MDSPCLAGCQGDVLSEGWLPDAGVMGDDSCREDGSCSQCELRKDSAWGHGAHHCTPSDSGKERCMHGCWADGLGQELPPHAALEDAWKENAHLLDLLLLA